MVDKLVENPGGLHARITCQIYLRPFTLYETELYLKSKGCAWDRYQILQCYMFFGGIPFYLSLLDTSLSFASPKRGRPAHTQGAPCQEEGICGARSVAGVHRC